MQGKTDAHVEFHVDNPIGANEVCWHSLLLHFDPRIFIYGAS
jgi:hypothetical protein